MLRLYLQINKPVNNLNIFRCFNSNILKIFKTNERNVIKYL